MRHTFTFFTKLNVICTLCALLSFLDVFVLSFYLYVNLNEINGDGDTEKRQMF